MCLLEINIAARVAIGIIAMVVLFTSFLLAFASSQRRKMRYQKEVQALMQHEQELLAGQNRTLELKVEDRTVELRHQKEALQASLSELKATQLQLIQREKMASLGELTAGIAHEIRNPLNFVTNFAEVTIELSAELEAALTQGDQVQAQDLLSDIKANLTKIIQHGGRANGIITGMLQHSRASGDKLEATDINKLLSECWRLGGQGFMAKEKGFSAKLITEFDTNLPLITINAQDVGRVILNLITNALYATKQKLAASTIPYQPEITLCTQISGKYLMVGVRDNGPGISPEIKEKVFQPFFTTKPAGEGTGLGLSLSYEIIKAHGGEIRMDSEQGLFTDFQILLPLPD